MKLDIARGAYRVDSDPLIRSRCVNLYPKVIEHKTTRSQVALFGTGGLSVWMSGPTGRVRGMLQVGDITYAVIGGTLYSISGGTETSLGAIPGNDPVAMLRNAAVPIQIFITDGSATFLDQYFIAARATFARIWNGTTLSTPTGFPTSTLTTTFYSSNLNNGSTWDALDFASAEGNPDDIVGLIANHRDLLIFGSETLETWLDVGGSDFPFIRQEGTFQERGCGAKNSIRALDNTVYFLGDDRVVYKIEGYRPVRISNHGVETALNGGDVSDAEGFTFTEAGHYFYGLTFKNQTWVYDATTSGILGQNEWHERQSSGGRWRVSANTFRQSDGKHLFGDFENGQIYTLDNDVYTDNGALIHRIRSVGPYQNQTDWVECRRLELKLENAVGASQLWLEISKDGGRTFSNKLFKDIPQNYDHDVVWRQLGRAKDWVFQWTMTDSVKCVWYEAYGDFTRSPG